MIKKILIAIVGGVVGLLILAWIVGSYTDTSTSSTSSSTQVALENAKDSGEDMISKLGCKGIYSDDKKAALFESDYKGKLTTVSGKIAKAGNGEVELIVLPTTLTYDLQVKVKDSHSVFDLEKGQHISIQFVPTSLGGCFLPFNGKDGVIVQSTSDQTR